MKEDLLHYVWHQRLLNKQPLTTTDGKRIDIIKTGVPNKDAGPDFFDARIKIDDTLWAGNVEIHINTSDWLKHKHQYDEAYKNVILHVVFNHDSTDVALPTLELRGLISPLLLNKYSVLQQYEVNVPCESIIALPDSIYLEQFLHRLAIERLETKCTLLEQDLQAYGNSWEKLFYVTLAKYFGMNVNAQPFIQLAQTLPANLLAKHKHNALQIDALLFGVAGFLTDVQATDAYHQQLTNEFLFLQKKYDLPTLNKSQWKFSKTRPANFPTIRLAQFSALVLQSTHLFSKLIEAKTIQQLQSLLSAKPSSQLNLEAFHHGSSNIELTVAGHQFIQNLIINALAPIKFLYGKHSINESLCEEALSWLEELQAEKNAIVSFWRSKNIKPTQAIHSQALVELTNNYCKKKKCLSCAIGNHILQHA